MGEEERRRFIKEKLDQGLSPFDTLDALADEAHDRGDHWTGYNARMAALDTIRPPEFYLSRGV